MSDVDEFKQFLRTNKEIKLTHNGLQCDEHSVTSVSHYQQADTGKRLWVVVCFDWSFLISYQLTGDKLLADGWEIKDFASTSELLRYLEKMMMQGEQKI
jgi:hypothetical protein